MPKASIIQILNLVRELGLTKKRRVDGLEVNTGC